MKKILFIIISSFIIILVIGCSNKNKSNLKPVIINTEQLKSVNINEKPIFNEIIEYLKEVKNVKGNIKDKIVINQIVDNSLENLELYEVALDYAWINGIAIIQDNKVLGLLIGMTKNELIFADLNNDNEYEVIFSGGFGSGLLYNVIEVMTIKDNKIYTTTIYKNNKRVKLVPNEVDNKVYIYWVYNYLDKEQLSEEPLGYLQIKDSKLMIEGLKETNDIKINYDVSNNQS